MTEAEEDLSGHYQVQESMVLNHPAYYKPVLITRYGWAKRKGFFGQDVHWYKQEITQIGESDEQSKLARIPGNAL